MLSTRTQLLPLVLALALLGNLNGVHAIVGGDIEIPLLDTAFDGINAATQAVVDDVNAVQSGVNDILAIPNTVSTEIQNQIQAAIDAGTAGVQAVVDGVNTFGSTKTGMVDTLLTSAPLILSGGLISAGATESELRTGNNKKAKETRRKKGGKKNRNKKGKKNRSALLGRRMLLEVDV